MGIALPPGRVLLSVTQSCLLLQALLLQALLLH